MVGSRDHGVVRRGRRGEKGRRDRHTICDASQVRTYNAHFINGSEASMASGSYATDLPSVQMRECCNPGAVFCRKGRGTRVHLYPTAQQRTTHIPYV